MTKVKFEGFINEITNEVVICRFMSENQEEFLMEVPIKEFSKKDREDLEVGYYLTYECSYKLKVLREMDADVEN